MSSGFRLPSFALINSWATWPRLPMGRFKTVSNGSIPVVSVSFLCSIKRWPKGEHREAGGVKSAGGSTQTMITVGHDHLCGRRKQSYPFRHLERVKVRSGHGTAAFTTNRGRVRVRQPWQCGTAPTPSLPVGRGPDLFGREPVGTLRRRLALPAVGECPLCLAGTCVGFRVFKANGGGYPGPAVTMRCRTDIRRSPHVD